MSKTWTVVIVSPEHSNLLLVKDTKESRYWEVPSSESYETDHHMDCWSAVDDVVAHYSIDDQCNWTMLAKGVIDTTDGTTNKLVMIELHKMIPNRMEMRTRMNYKWVPLATFKDGRKKEGMLNTMTKRSRSKLPTILNRIAKCK